MPDKTVIQRIATKAVIVNSRKQILILREASTYKEGTNIGRYHMPGGRLNAGEPYLEGLKREVGEETGLKIKIGKPIYIGEWWPVIKDQQNQIVAIFFACHALTEKVRLSEEHDDYKWIEPKNYKQYDLMPPEDKVIEAYLDLV